MFAVSINFYNWREFVMYESMKILIGRKFYKTAEAARKKLDVFYARNRITDEEYMELDDLVNTVYGGADENGG